MELGCPLIIGHNNLQKPWKCVFSHKSQVEIVGKAAFTRQRFRSYPQ